MTDYTLALLSDIHGNRWSLEAVLEDINARNVERIINLGDCLYGYLDPNGTAEILLSLDIPTVRGNEDRMLYETEHSSPTLEFTKKNISKNHIAWLRSFPLSMEIEKKILVCHATPQRDNEYLLYDVTPNGIALSSEEDIIQKLGDAKQKIILTGHDHMQNVIRLSDYRLIVNPGSVGLPAYDDDTPHYHEVENGSPHAKYSILYIKEDNIRIENIILDYDYESAADAAMKNGSETWHHWIKTGRA